MTVGELKQHLSYYDDDMEVCVAYQPGYPMQIHLQSLMVANENSTKVYLVQHEGIDNAHLNEYVQGEIGWG